MKEYEFFNAAEMGMKIDESADRKNLRSLDREREEDDIRIEDNQKRKFITAEDLMDESIEEDPETDPEQEPESPDDHPEGTIMTAERPVIQELNTETGKMGAAHADGQTVFINREKGEATSKAFLTNEREKEELIAKYESLEDELDHNYPANKGDRYANETESHGGDNLKTLPDNKKEREKRGFLRSIFKSF